MTEGADEIDRLLDAMEDEEHRRAAEIRNRYRPPRLEEIPTTNGAMRSTGGTFYEVPPRRFYTTNPPPFDPTKHQALTITIFGLLPWAASESPWTALKHVRMLRERLDELEREAVGLARSHRWSWKAISDVLGTHRSALHRRFAKAEITSRTRRSRGEC